MVKFKPHLITVYSLVESESVDGTIFSHGYNPLGVGIAAMVHPLRTQQAFEITGSELNEPMSVFIDATDANKISVNFKVLFNNETYYVVNPPERFSHNLSGDHVRFVMAKGQMEQAE